MPCFQQLCFAHIQLAIIDVLYKENLTQEENQDQGGLRRFQEIDNANQSELSDVDDDDEDKGSFIVDSFIYEDSFEL